MSLQLTDTERSRLEGMARRPRSRKQLYRAEALLALADGQPIEAVARRFRVGVERIEDWAARFESQRLHFLAEPDAGRPRAERGRNDENGEYDEDE